MAIFALVFTLIQFMIWIQTSQQQVPSSGCHTISSEGHCYRHFDRYLDWDDSRRDCANDGYTLATATTLSENAVMFSVTGSWPWCWIGLNDILNEGTYVWDDGDNSTFTNWGTSKPSNTGNCALTLNGGRYNDYSCSSILRCRICSQTVNAFGQVNGTISTALSDNVLLNSNTTLYCVTENTNTPQVTWRYTDPAGSITVISSTTDTNTGVSTIDVVTAKPGYYACEVTENGESSRIYTAQMQDPSPPGVVAKVNATVQGANSVEVTWDPPSTEDRHGTISSYKILITGDPFDNVERSVSIIPHSDPEQGYTHTLTLLQEYNTYNIQIIAVDENGEGGSVTTYSHTDAAAPSAAPQSLSLTVNSSTEIQLDFNPPPSVDQNGLITSYTVTYTGVTVDTTPTQQVIPTTSTTYPAVASVTFTIENLKENNEYTFSVYASTSAGDGPETASDSVTTLLASTTSTLNARLYVVCFAVPIVILLITLVLVLSLMLVLACAWNRKRRILRTKSRSSPTKQTQIEREGKTVEGKERENVYPTAESEAKEVTVTKSLAKEPNN